MPDLAVKSTPVTSGENLLSLVGHFFFVKLKDGNRDYMYVFSALCSKQARGPRGSCQHFCVAPRRFNGKCIDYSFRDLQLT